MATNNSINKNTESLTINSAAATDSYTQYNVNSVAKWRAGNDATDDSYRISTSTLGSSDSLIITSSGNTTLPLQCSFSAYVPTSILNVTGDGTVYSLIYGTEVFDIGSNYNNATGIFTAPVTGKYLFTNHTYIQALTTAMTSTSITLVTTNGTYFGNNYSLTAGVPAPNRGYVISIYCDMTAGDTAYCSFVASGGTKVVDIYGAAARTSYFAGILIN